MLGDIVTAINEVVGEALKADDSAFSGTQLHKAIQLCLNDLSNEDILAGTDDEQTLSSGDLNLDYPTDFKSLISIVLINSSGVRQTPLEKLKGGHREYKEFRDNDNTNGEPEAYSEFDNKFWLWRPSSGSYTTEIEYYRKHPQTPTAILFGEECRNAIYFGTIYYKALLRGMSAHIARWLPVYLAEKEERRAAAPAEPRICRG